jgi:hypothetical protein
LRIAHPAAVGLRALGPFSFHLGSTQFVRRSDARRTVKTLAPTGLAYFQTTKDYKMINANHRLRLDRNEFRARHRAKYREARTRRLALESLETRQMLSASALTLISHAANSAVAANASSFVDQPGHNVLMIPAR